MGRVLKNLGRVMPAELPEAHPPPEVHHRVTARIGAASARASRVSEDPADQSAAEMAEMAARREEARRQGFEDGRAAAEARVTEQLATLAMLVAGVERARAEAQPLALKMAVKLAASMAEKIVGRAVELAPAVLAEIAGQALHASRARAGLVKLRVHPEDLAILERDPLRARLVARIAAGAELRLLGDPTIARYGCIVETSAGRLDARLETQLGALEQALLGERAHG